MMASAAFNLAFGRSTARSKTLQRNRATCHQVLLKEYRAEKARLRRTISDLHDAISFESAAITVQGEIQTRLQAEGMPP